MSVRQVVRLAGWVDAGWNAIEEGRTTPVDNAPFLYRLREIVIKDIR